VVVNMPRKAKPRKPIAFPDQVWIAPRPAKTPKPRIFEPVSIAESNRYLEFADIALGAKKSTSQKKKPRSTPVHAQKQHAQHHHDPKGKVTPGKVTPINSRTSNPRGPNQGFGAFRNSR
jgi:hypothetical protein